MSFGSVTVGTTSAAVTVVVTNNSRAGIWFRQDSSSLPEFIVTGPTLPLYLPPYGKTSIKVAFRPNAALPYSGSIVVGTSNQDNQIAKINVSGTGTSSTSTQSHLLSSSVSSLNFGNTLVGSSASQAFTLKNTGTGNVNISQVTSIGGGFKVTGFSGAVTLAAGQSLPLTASFAPATTGAVVGTISVVSTATNSPATISLSGTGVQPQPQISVIPSTVSFGSVAVGVTNTQTLTIRNAGTATLNVSQASLTGTGFTSSGLALPLSVPAGGSSSFNVGFHPASAGTFSGSVTLISNTANSPLVVPISGTGVASLLQLSASPASLSFGSLTTGTTATQSVTISNNGNASVSISQVSATGAGFSTSGIALPLSLAAGQSTSFSVKFAPTSTGNLPGSVTVVSNATNSPLVVALSGTGAAPASHTVLLSWTPSSSTFLGFNIYRGTTSGGPYAKVDTSTISSTSYVDSNVSSGQTYYYVATELDSTGTESTYSSQVSATIP